MEQANFIKINPADNVVVCLKPLAKGETIAIDGKVITLLQDTPAGHKVLLEDKAEGENIIKYGYPIGRAKTAIKKGEWVHTFNVKTALSEEAEYTYDEEVAKESVLEMNAKKAIYASSGVPSNWPK